MRFRFDSLIIKQALKDLILTYRSINYTRPVLCTKKISYYAVPANPLMSPHIDMPWNVKGIVVRLPLNLIHRRPTISKIYNLLYFNTI